MTEQDKSELPSLVSCAFITGLFSLFVIYYIMLHVCRIKQTSELECNQFLIKTTPVINLGFEEGKICSHTWLGCITSLPG